jgi:uncharacterized protein (TIGR03437 family)
MFATGLKNTPGLNPNAPTAVTVTFNGSTNAAVSYAGPAPFFPGVDQLNVVVPPGMAGAGSVNIRITAGGRVSNAVTARIQ